MEPVEGSHSGTPPDDGKLAWLLDELTAWTRGGIVTEDQARRIRARYDLSEVELDRHAGPGKLIAAVAIMGALLCGAGILTFIASNWDEMSDGLRLALIFSTVIGFQWGGYELAFRRANYPRIGQALLLVGALAYGAGIFLVAQIFHLDDHYPNGFLLWGIGALAVAIAVRSLPVFTVAASAFAIWTSCETADFGKAHWIGLGVIAAAVLPLAAVRRSPGHMSVAVLAVATWFAFAPAGWDNSEHQLFAGWLAAAGLLLAVGSLHISAGLPQFGIPWRAVATFGAMVVAYLLSFHDLVSEVAPREARAGVTPWHVLLIALAASASLAAVARARNILQRWEAFAALALAALAFFWITLAARDISSAVALLFNLAFFGGAVGLVALGTHERSAATAYQGLGWFGLGLFSRYVDLGFELMDKSLFFVFGGLLLIGVGWVLERQRRRIAATLREGRP